MTVFTDNSNRHSNMGYSIKRELDSNWSMVLVKDEGVDCIQMWLTSNNISKICTRTQTHTHRDREMFVRETVIDFGALPQTI